MDILLERQDKPGRPSWYWLIVDAAGRDVDGGQDLYKTKTAARAAVRSWILEIATGRLPTGGQWGPRLTRPEAIDLARRAGWLPC